MFCISCGTQLPDGAAFCAGCGQAVAGGAATSGGTTLDTQKVNECFQKIISMANKRKGQITEEQARVLLATYDSPIVMKATDMYRTLWKNGHLRK